VLRRYAISSFTLLEFVANGMLQLYVLSVILQFGWLYLVMCWATNAIVCHGMIWCIILRHPYLVCVFCHRWMLILRRTDGKGGHWICLFSTGEYAVIRSCVVFILYCTV